jgi:hypothetical protein
MAMTTAPTWTEIYNLYLKSGTIGNCNGGFSCHATISSAPNAYSFLQAYMGGSPPRLVSRGSVLSWYGGNMPIGGPQSNAQATTDMNAWAAAGAKNN